MVVLVQALILALIVVPVLALIVVPVLALIVLLILAAVIFLLATVVLLILAAVIDFLFVVLILIRVARCGSLAPGSLPILPRILAMIIRLVVVLPHLLLELLRMFLFAFFLDLPWIALSLAVISALMLLVTAMGSIDLNLDHAPLVLDRGKAEVMSQRPSAEEATRFQHFHAKVRTTLLTP